MFKENASRGIGFKKWKQNVRYVTLKGGLDLETAQLLHILHITLLR
jgi:hypothetical protein